MEFLKKFLLYIVLFTLLAFALFGLITLVMYLFSTHWGGFVIIGFIIVLLSVLAALGSMD